MLKKIYVNQPRADVITGDIINQLEVLEKQFEKMAELINKCVYKNIITGEKKSFAISLSRKCSDFSKNVCFSYRSFEKSYNSDKNEYTLNILEEKIKKLEEKIDLLLK